MTSWPLRWHWSGRPGVVYQFLCLVPVPPLHVSLAYIAALYTFLNSLLCRFINTAEKKFSSTHHLKHDGDLSTTCVQMWYGQSVQSTLESFESCCFSVSNLNALVRNTHTHAIDSMSIPPFLIGHQTVIKFPWIPTLGISRLKSNRVVSACSDHGDLSESTILHRRLNSLQVDTNLNRLGLRLKHRHHHTHLAANARYALRGDPIADWTTAAIALTILAIRITSGVGHCCCLSSSVPMKMKMLKQKWWTRRNRTIILTSKLILSQHKDLQSFDICRWHCCCIRCCFSNHSFGLGFPDPALLLTFSFLRFKNEFLPETSDLVELCDGPSSGTEGMFKSSFFLHKFSMLILNCFFLLLSLSMQNGKTELKLADLTIIALALLVKAVILSAQLS